ncbi:MAG: VTC domain-containing protein [Kofleriaceae bacterium]|nr:MAG: VTC domain-containing protein [Kofleriaceae bacterium]
MQTPSLLHSDDRQLEQRERKFLPDADAARAFWKIASARLRPEHGPGAVSYSRTTYFDTPDLAYYRSCGGPILRRVRVREYAVASDPEGSPRRLEHCYLELKQSNASMRSKVRLRLQPAEVARELAALTDASLAPCVTTWYRRRALVGDDGLRVTLDDRLLLCRPLPVGSPLVPVDPDDVIVHGPSLVLECKSKGTPPRWLTEALAGMREELGFSKFVLGMNAVMTTSFTSHTAEQLAAAR